MLLNSPSIRHFENDVGPIARVDTFLVLVAWLAMQQSMSSCPCNRPLSRRLDRCDRVIQNESGDSDGGSV